MNKDILKTTLPCAVLPQFWVRLSQRCYRQSPCLGPPCHSAQCPAQLPEIFKVQIWSRGFPASSPWGISHSLQSRFLAGCSGLCMNWFPQPFLALVRAITLTPPCRQPPWTQCCSTPLHLHMLFLLRGKSFSLCPLANLFVPWNSTLIQPVL